MVYLDLVNTGVNQLLFRETLRNAVRLDQVINFLAPLIGLQQIQQFTQQS